MNRTERGKALQSRIDDATEELSRQLENGMPERFLEYLRFYATHSATYSIGNTMLIKMQHPRATFCTGMRKWNELECSVKKGESAIWIRAPRFKKVTDPQTGLEELKLIGYLAVPVFDISQVEGAEKLPAARVPLEGSFEQLYEALLQKAGENGITVVEQHLSRVLGGVAMDRAIAIHSGNPTSVKLQTLIHEIAHVLLHPPGCETPVYQRELEAEATTYVVTHLLDFPAEASAGYILTWQGNAVRLQHSLQAIHYATKTIFGWLEAAQVEVSV